MHTLTDFPGGSDGKASAYNAGDLGSIPGWGRSPGEGNGNPLQYSGLENPMDRGACRLQSMGSQRVGHDWATSYTNFIYTLTVRDTQLDTIDSAFKYPDVQVASTILFAWSLTLLPGLPLWLHCPPLLLFHLLWLSDLLAVQTCQAGPSSGLLHDLSLCQSASSTLKWMGFFFFEPFDQAAS